MATVTIEIPDQLANQAEAMGLLRTDALALCIAVQFSNCLGT
jgi:hypothetical protein